MSDSYVTDPSVLCVSLYLSAFGFIVLLGVAPSLLEVVVFSVVVAAFFASSSGSTPPLVAYLIVFSGFFGLTTFFFIKFVVWITALTGIGYLVPCAGAILFA